MNTISVRGETVVSKIRREFREMGKDFEIFQCFIDNPNCIRHVVRFMRNIKEVLTAEVMTNLLDGSRHIDGAITEEDYRWLKEQSL